MKYLCLATLLILCACSPAAPPAASPAVSASAPARMERLSVSNARWCTEDGIWCVSASGPNPVVINTRANTSIDLPAAAGSEPEVWPSIVRQGDSAGENVIVGIDSKQGTSYSGGGGSVTSVDLYKIAGATATRLLTAPLSSAIDIRACFSQADTRARRDACSDQYNFTATLALDPSAPAGPPRFILTTEATTFPGRRTRSSDSTTAPPLGPNDLVTARDETCSYRRVFAANPAGEYTPDQPLPACEDYLQP